MQRRGTTVGPATRVSVVVCVYTEARWDDIVAGIRAAETGTRPPDQIVLVVDHNPDLLARLRTGLPGAHPSLSVVPSTGGRGLSGARNTGIAAADGTVIAFLDDDAVPGPRWLETLVAPFATPTVMAVGGRAEPVWPTHRPTWFPEEFDWVIGCSYRGLPTTRAPVRNVIGCSMAFRAGAFELAGGFVEGVGRVGTVPRGAEETELCIRLRQLSTDPVEIVYEPASLVWHRVSDDRTAARYFYRRCFAEGRSKAQIGALVGHADGTSSERAYTTRTLPLGVARGLLDTVRGQRSAWLRSVTIVGGLAVTTAGYLVGRLGQLVAARRAPR